MAQIWVAEGNEATVDRSVTRPHVLSDLMRLWRDRFPHSLFSFRHFGAIGAHTAPAGTPWGPGMLYYQMAVKYLVIALNLPYIWRCMLEESSPFIQAKGRMNSLITSWPFKNRICR